MCLIGYKLLPVWIPQLHIHGMEEFGPLVNILRQVKSLIVIITQAKVFMVSLQIFLLAIIKLSTVYVNIKRCVKQKKNAFKGWMTFSRLFWIAGYKLFRNNLVHKEYWTCKQFNRQNHLIMLCVLLIFLLEIKIDI